MSNLLVNIRFGSYHLQITRDFRSWWHYRKSNYTRAFTTKDDTLFLVGWLYNGYHDGDIRKESSWRWFKVHEFFGWCADD